MGYALPDGLFCCLVGDRFVFLDLPRDRYFCLREAQDAAFRALLDGSISKADAPLLDQMVAGQTLALVAADLVPTTCTAPPEATETMADAREAATAGRHLPRAACQLLVSAIALRRFHLEAIVDRFRHAKAKRLARSVRPSYDLASIARAYRAIGLLVPMHDKCLMRSIALAHHLTDLGAVPDLVFGVRLQPFKAHCWVQLGTVLIVDRIDDVRLFTPILVV